MTAFFSVSSAIPLTKNNEIENDGYKKTILTSPVFCEFYTDSSNIKGIETAKLIQNIYKSGGYNFNYITILSDIYNQASDGLIRDYNIIGYPTSIFQGGYETLYNETPVESIYKNKINVVQNRNVPNIDIYIEPNWFADCCSSKADFKITVTNKESYTYNGILKLYISEIVSRYNYTYEDTLESFNYVLLDIPIEQTITILPYSNITVEKEWIATTFAKTGENLNVVAIVAYALPYTGYSDPPFNQNSFNAYYIDQINSQRIVKTKLKSIEENFNYFQKILNHFPNLNNIIKNIFF